MHWAFRMPTSGLRPPGDRGLWSLGCALSLKPEAIAVGCGVVVSKEEDIVPVG